MRQRLTRLRPWLALVIRLALGAMFLAAGWLKLPYPESSAQAVRAYRLLPEALVPVIGYGLPVFEVILGLLLIIGLATRICAIISGLLMLAFIIGISSAAIRGINIDCGCFGSGGPVAEGETRYTLDLIRDATAMVGSILLAIWPRSALSLDVLVSRWMRGGHHTFATEPEPTTPAPATEKKGQ